MEAPTAFILYSSQEAEKKMRMMEQSGKERGDGLQWLKEGYGAQITAQRRSDLIAAAWGRTRNNRVALFRASAGLAVSVRTGPEDLPRAGPVPTAAPAPDTVPEQLAPPAPGAPLPDLDLRTWNLNSVGSQVAASKGSSHTEATPPNFEVSFASQGHFDWTSTRPPEGRWKAAEPRPRVLQV
jgi:hypothetical protein